MTNDDEERPDGAPDTAHAVRGLAPAHAAALAGVCANDNPAALEASGAEGAANAGFRHLIENFADGILVVDLEGTVLYANPAATEIFDHPAGEPLRISLGHRLTAGETTDLTVYRQGRQSAEVEMHLVEVTWHGQPALLAGMRDISARRAQEERRRQLEKLEAVGRLSAGVFHDFNNLLAVFDSGFRLLRTRLGDAGADPQINILLDEMAERVQNGSALTRQLLDLSRQQPRVRGAVDVNARIEALTHLLGQTLDKGIILRRSLDPALGSVLVDANRLDTAILNLVINARDAMDGVGTVTIETSAVSIDDGKGPDGPTGFARITVADTGRGMGEEIRGRVFEPFFTTKGEGKGTGLGLPQVNDFVNRVGGRIEIESSPGIGTKIHLLLPLIASGEPLP